MNQCPCGWVFPVGLRSETKLKTDGPGAKVVSSKVEITFACPSCKRAYCFTYDGSQGEPAIKELPS